jgi:hypothetical protein
VTCLHCPFNGNGFVNISTATDTNMTTDSNVKGSVIYVVHASIVYREPLGEVVQLQVSGSPQGQKLSMAAVK